MCFDRQGMRFVLEQTHNNRQGTRVLCFKTSRKPEYVEVDKRTRPRRHSVNDI